MRLFQKIMIVLSGLFILILLIANCNRLSPIEPALNDDVAISASIHFPDGSLAAAGITKMTLVVTDKDKKVVQQSLTLNNGGARGQVKVAKNKLLTYTVTAYIDTTEIMKGDTLFKAVSGGKNNLHITLNLLVPALILTPSTGSVTKGEDITIYVKACRVADLGAIGTQVTFDTSKVQVKDLGREDTFLKSGGGSVNTLKFSKDNIKGKVDIVLGVFPGSSAVTGDGTIGRIVFEARQKGVVDLQLLLDNTVDPDLGLYDKNANLLYAIGLGGRITITE
jgi:hypothetical protein